MAFLHYTGQHKVLTNGEKAHEELVMDERIHMNERGFVRIGMRIDSAYLLCQNCDDKVNHSWIFLWHMQIGNKRLTQKWRCCDKCLVELGLVW